MMQDVCLYGILDLGYVRQDEIVAVARRLVQSGTGVIQLRAKNHHEAEIEAMAGELLPVFRAAGVSFLINDFPEIAGRVDADGFHIGQDDGSRSDAVASYHAARHPAMERRVPLVGRSTHSLEQAVAAEEEGFDYIGFGPLFPTPTKPGRSAIGLGNVAEVHRLVALPVFCIGGIKRSNIEEVIRAGARRVVVVSDLLEAGEDIPRMGRQLLEVIAGAERD